MASVKDGIAAQVHNIEARCGRPLSEWFGLIAVAGRRIRRRGLRPG